MSEANTIHQAVERPLTEWKHEPTLADLKADYLAARSGHDSSVSQIDRWLDNLHVRGTAKLPRSKTHSSIQPKLIRKQAEWRYAALSEPFLATPDMFKVAPVTWEDVDAAKQNGLVLNNQWNTKIDKVAFVDEYVRTAVDEGTVIVRLGWVHEEEEYTEMAPTVRFFVNPDYAPIIEQLEVLKAENPSAYYTLPEPLRQAHELSIEQGEPVEPEITGEREVTKTRVIKNHPTVEVCDYHNVILDPTSKGDIRKANFLIYEFEASLSTLRKDGRYKNLDAINLESNSVLGEPDYASPDDAKNFSFSDEARKLFVVREYWGFRDLDGSGVVRPFLAAWVGDTKVRMEENPFPDREIPFVKVQYLPVRKANYGEPDGALLEDNQRVLGAVTRGVVDLMGKSANAQQGVRKEALDIVNRRKFEEGKDYEFNPHINDPRTAIFQHVFPEVPRSAEFMINLQNIEAESMTGVKSFANNGLAGEALGKTSATAARGVLDAASKRELGILRRLSQGMLEIARKTIAMNQEFLSEEETVRVTNEEFVQVRRDDLGGHFDLRLDISTAEDDNAKAQELAFILQTIGPEEDPMVRKIVLANIMRLRKMPDLAKAIEDYEPQPDPKQERIAELTILKLEKEIEKIVSETQENLADAQLHMARAGTEGAKVGKIAAEVDQASLDFVEQESGVKQERALQQTAEQAKSQAKLAAIQHRFDREDKIDDLVLAEAKRLQKFQGKRGTGLRSASPA